MSPRLSITLVCLTLVPFLSGCAYGYAGQKGRDRVEPTEETNVAVVEVKETEVPEESEPTAEPAEPTAPESPCGVDTFDIHFYGDGAHVTKTIDCVSRKIVDVSRTPMAESQFMQARAAGLPEAAWYILVDPRGNRQDILDNTALLKLSLVFQIDYFGRDTSSDLLVYLYDDQPR